MKNTLKNFTLGVMFTIFAFSLAVNYLYYTGRFTNTPMTDEQRLNNELAGL